MTDSADEPLRFSEGTAEGRPRSFVRRKGWLSPTRAVHVPPGWTADLAGRCTAIQKSLPPEAVFTHVTAALLRGWWLPRCLMEAPIIASTGGDFPHHDRRGVYVRRCRVPTESRRTLGDIRIASPEWTIVELGEVLELIDLVAVIESAVYLKHTTVQKVWDALVPRRRGVRNLRRALSLVDGRAESAWEVYLRLLHALSGINDIHPQQVIRDSMGAFVARVDLRLGKTLTFCEYDGADHRGQRRHVKDLRREKAINRIGGRRMGYTAIEILHEAKLILRDSQQALALPPESVDMRPWMREFNLSALSDVGEQKLLRRMEHYVRARPPRRSAKATATRRVA